MESDNIYDLTIDKIGIYGISGGARLALLLTAIDERINVSVISGYLKDTLSSLSDLALGKGFYLRNDYYFRSSYYYVPYPFCSKYDNYNLIRMIYPRPILFENGDKDLVLKMYNDRKEFERISEIYSNQNLSERIEFRSHPGAHEIFDDAGSDWIIRWFKELG